MAAEYGHLAFVAYLVAKGSAMDTRTSTGQTAMALARCRGERRVFDYLSAVGFE